MWHCSCGLSRQGNIQTEKRAKKNVVMPAPAYNYHDYLLKKSGSVTEVSAHPHGPIGVLQHSHITFFQLKAAQSVLVHNLLTDRVALEV